MEGLAIRDDFERSSLATKPYQFQAGGPQDSQWTPPQTPLALSHLEDDEVEQETGGFHNYLRAFYPYRPASTISSSDGDESSVTVPISQGDVILVHSVQPNGWADGTLLASGARGWLPTNYCEPYDPELMRNLLDSLTYTWEFVRGHEEDDPQVFSGQDYVRGVIAGVRLLLQQTHCLSREEALVKNVNGLRRARRYMLSDLSAFSKAATSLQEVCQTGLSRDALYDMLDDIVMRAFKVTTRAVRFLDSWMHHVGERTQEHTPPLTPPVVISEAFEDESSTGKRFSQRRSALYRLSGISQIQTPLSPTFPVGSTAGMSDPLTSDSLNVPHGSPARPTRPTSHLQKRISASHRLSYSARSPLIRDRKFASDSLTAAHDAFLSSLGVFTGLHLQSRASMELLSETKQAVVACSALLDIIDEIMLRDNRHFQALEDAKEHLKASVASLIRTIGAQARDDEDFFIRNAEHPPILAATTCVRSASACVAEASAMIARVGDFELSMGRDTNGHGKSQSVESTKTGQKERPAPLAIEEEGYEVLEKPLPNSPPPPSPPSQSDKSHVAAEPVSLSTSSSSSRLEAIHATADGMCSRVSCDTVVRPSSRLELEGTQERKKIPSLELDIPQTSPLLFPELGSSNEQSPDSQNDSRVVSFAATNSTDLSSLRWSKDSYQSQPSTVATTPDQSPIRERAVFDLKGSFGSLSESQSTIADDTDDDEAEVFTTRYAHELSLSKDGQVLGGTLPALVERLTIHDVTPDALFVNTFYLTFRQFCTPLEFAQTLSDRFEYIGQTPVISGCVRLRIFNVIKGWLDLHWRCETDNEAIPVFVEMAHGTLQKALPSASVKLLQLLDKAPFITHSEKSTRVVSLQGKTNTVIGSTDDLNSPEPTPVISKSQWALLKKFALQTATLSILDFDPLELARQFTLIESKIFCQIRPDELLDCEFNKTAPTSRAVNVKAMSKLSTDLANLVADTILQHIEPKKRAAVIKQWVKIAKKCRELNNYDSLVAILCSLNSSMISRLKKTWDLVPAKTIARLDQLRPIGEGRMTLLRKLLENHGAPCIPFVGLTLTDLTMNHEANAKTRKLGRSAGSTSLMSPGAEKNIINFDRYFRTARSIGDLQRFQVGYNLKPVPAMQAWMRSQIERVHVDKDASAAAYYRRSVMLEPRDQPAQAQPSSASSANTSFSSVSSTGDRPPLSAKQSFWKSLGLPQAMYSKDEVSA